MTRFLVFVVNIALPTYLSAADWSYYGADPGGSQYSYLDQINVDNVQDLEEVWRYNTGDLKNKPRAIKHSAFEATPIIIGDQLIFCTPFNEVISLDPVSGEEQWRFDPKISLEQHPANQYVCRGVSYWRDHRGSGQEICSERIFMGTNDRRIISLDKLSGKPCTEFGNDGEVTLDPGMPLRWDGEFQITSPPAIINDLVIVGSAISDNLRANAPRGIVRAYSARSGKLVWQFDPISKNDDKTWQNQSAKVTGHANVWAPMSVDAENDLVFLPTSSPSPDFYGGKRLGDNLYADSH